MTLVTFAAILWQLSGSFVLPILGGLTIPGYMMWAALGYALVGSWATYRIGWPLVGTNFDLERRNADFRFRMVRIRENAESIALYRGELDEQRRLRKAFGRVYAIWWDLMTYTKRLTWLTGFYGQAASVFPIIVAAPHYFAGTIPLGVLTQTTNAFGQVQGALSWFVDTYTTLAAWKAVIDRLTSFGEAMARAKKAAMDDAFEIFPQPSKVSLQHVDVVLPTGTLLLRDVNLTVHAGEWVVLRGASGAGKTTLFRVLAGLWPYGRGRIGLPRDARVLFLPQKPYLPMGTLKEVLTYPEGADRHSDEVCREVLQACSLEHLVARLSDTDNWAFILSGGEQQRLAFARSLLYRPDWLFIDEATSALDQPTERLIYSLLVERLPQAALISIAHTPEDPSSHKREVNVDSWSHHASPKMQSRSQCQPTRKMEVQPGIPG
jgi:putative ATP-binding cassette transporter